MHKMQISSSRIELAVNFAVTNVNWIKLRRLN